MKLKHYLFTIILMCGSLVGYMPISAQEFLSPEKAFVISGELLDSAVRINVKPQSGYYVYKESIAVQELGAAEPLKNVQQQLPVAKKKFDENFQKIVETYASPISFEISTAVLKNGLPLQLEVTVQGCAEKGICYPPMTRTLTLSEYGVEKVSTSVEEALKTLPQGNGSISDWWTSRDDISALTKLLESTSLPVLLLVFFILGIGLAFTPCMLPMLPILSSIIFGTTHHHLLSRKRTITLATLYVAGMAIAFSLAGMATAWFGSGVQAALQNPIVMFGFAGLMLVLAGSLLGLYEFHLPQFWHAHVDKLIGKQKGGSLVGAFVLGALSSLVASPCITAPMAGVLTFIAQSGEVKLGGLILFTMAWGMGVPLLLFALGASRVVPRAGAWMMLVQKIFGVLMVALAIWFVWPAVSSLIATNHSESKNISGLSFKVVRTQAELKIALDKAKVDSKPVVLNFYADWCVSCKELEMLTFSDPRVASKLEKYERVEVDVTKSDNDQKELLKQFGLFGPPALIFIGADGIEKKSARAVGYLSADKLLLKM